MKKVKTQYHSLAVLFSLQIAFASFSLNSHAVDIDDEIQKKNKIYEELKLTIKSAVKKDIINNKEDSKENFAIINNDSAADEFKVSLKKASIESESSSSNPF